MKNPSIKLSQLIGDLAVVLKEEGDRDVVVWTGEGDSYQTIIAYDRDRSGDLVLTIGPH